MRSSLSFAEPRRSSASTSARPVASESIRPAAGQRSQSGQSLSQRPGLWRRILARFGVERLRQAAAADAYRDAIGASLYRLAGLAEGVANEGYRAGEACTNLALQSKTLSEGLIESEVEIDRIAQIAAENGSASVALQAEMKSTAERLDECVGQTRKQGHLIDDLFVSVERSRTGFVEVNACVDEVERFLTIVHEIGSQAGLLALNAAIEAASAGAHGHGFFVLASEMRRLADKTAATIEQTRRMTERMRVSTATASELIATACLAAHPSQQRGERLIAAMAGCSDMVRHAESSAERSALASQQQIDAVNAMHTRLQGMRYAAYNCTFDADAAAEMSLHTLNLSVGLYEELEGLGRDLKADDPASDHCLSKYSSAVASAAARCRERAGFNELERSRPMIQAALHSLEEECLRRGPATRRGRAKEGDRMPDLCFGGKSVNYSEEQVDAVRRQTGLTATLFVRSDATDGTPTFYRVATTVTRRDGERAVGTQLNPKGTVARKLEAGQSTYGYVYILGVPYISAYAPILDSAGEMVGAMYAGRVTGGRDFSAITAKT